MQMTQRDFRQFNGQRFISVGDDARPAISEG
jgi:hypothetical protein